MDLQRLVSRFLSAVLTGRIKRVDDSGSAQVLQGDFGPKGPDGSMRLFDNMPVIGLFGHTSNPPLESDVVAVFLRGDPTSGLVVAHNHQASRLRDLAPGDSALYDVRGVYLWLTAAGPVMDAGGLDIMIRNAGTVTVVASDKVRVEAPKVECTGDFVSRCDGTPVSLNALRDAYDAHKHSGVQPGGGYTNTTDHPI